ncbi:MAG: Trypsin domain protein [Candidatus Giovannonibacteria bacterium GW2011_GWC2_44_8]|uniref:Trypsin domain protein n=1 Tax=Candidatus Giovannonibacteria bacterium GW2011_GWC2_44_8 TaxID=1618657 RepID=A0A0G1K0Y9_9BACT|nr:MAG: Trypsin domain protein [Candidatus Giovannonibacteria bacterium GW2011_GWC2_44_8]
MEHLTKSQLILLVLLVSFVTSMVTGIMTVALLSEGAGENPIQTIQRVIEKSANSPPAADSPAVSDQDNNIVRIVENVSPAVVSIVAAKDVSVIENYYLTPFGDILADYGIQRRQVGAGSGFFVSGDGMIVTNKHVVQDQSASYTIILKSGKNVGAKVLALDPIKDIAVLKVEDLPAGGYPFIHLGDSSGLKVGQTVIAIGNALGEFQNTVSVGVISGLSRTITASGGFSGPEVLAQAIQTDAAINPGNSGGPLLDLSGRAIGINSAVAQGAENIGFAMPIDSVKKAIEDVKSFGKIRYPYLGVRYVIINPAVKESRKLPVDYGALVTASEGELAVLSNSPAKKAGIQQGDIILEFSGKKIDQNNALADLIADKKIGDKVSLKILREGKEISLEATLEEMP